MDSLRQLLATDSSLTATAEIEIRIALSEALTGPDPTEALKTLEGAYLLSQELEKPAHRAAIAFRLGSLRFRLAQYETALGDLQEATAYFEKTEDWDMLGKIYNRTGTIYQALNDYPLSRKYFGLSLGFHRRMKDTSRIIALYNNLGITLYKEGRYKTALEFYRKALQLNEKHNPQTPLAQILTNTGSLHGELKEYDRAREYLLEALEVYQKTQNQDGIVFAKEGLGLIQMDQDSLEKAMATFEEVQQRLEQFPRPYMTLYNQMDRGICQRKLGNPETALALHQEALPALEKMGDKQLHTACLEQVGRDLIALNRPSEAIKALQQGLTYALEINDKLLERDLHEALAKAYEATQKTSRAAYHSARHTHMEDSLEQIAQELVPLQIQTQSEFENDKQRQEAQALSAEKEAEEVANKRETILLIVIGVIAVLLLLYGFLFYRNKNRRSS